MPPSATIGGPDDRRSRNRLTQTSVRARKTENGAAAGSVFEISLRRFRLPEWPPPHRGPSTACWFEYRAGDPVDSIPRTRLTASLHRGNRWFPRWGWHAWRLWTCAPPGAWSRLRYVGSRSTQSGVGGFASRAAGGGLRPSPPA